VAPLISRFWHLLRIPRWFGHPYRFNPATQTGASGHLWSGGLASVL